MDSKSFPAYKTKIANNQTESSYLIQSNESQSEQKMANDMINKEPNKRTIEVVCKKIFFLLKIFKHIRL